MTPAAIVSGVGVCRVYDTGGITLTLTLPPPLALALTLTLTLTR